MEEVLHKIQFLILRCCSQSYSELTKVIFMFWTLIFGHFWKEAVESKILGQLPAKERTDSNINQGKQNMEAFSRRFNPAINASDKQT